LSEDVRQRPHIILGQDKDGNTLYFSRIGALNDFLEWFGLDTADQEIKDIMDGDMTVQDFLINIPKSAVNKLAAGVTPAIKSPAELATGQRLYPDIFDPYPTRDRLQNLMSSFGLRNEYDEIMGKPTRPYFENLNTALIYKTDPEESAYYQVLNDKRKFQEKKGDDSKMFFYTKKSNALYNMKLAIKYGDEKARKKYLQEYVKLGGTKDGMKRSLESMHPLYGLNDKDEKEFLKSLDKKEREKLETAIKYYKELMK